MSRDRLRKILIVFTGGTISSRMKDGVFAVDDSAYQLLDMLPKNTYDIETMDPINILSENMTPPLLYSLFADITARIDNAMFDAILIAHGTDTLAYTAHIADYILSGLSIPVVLFGAKYPFEHPLSDGPINFQSALQLINHIRSGVYVTSRSADGIDYVHAAEYVMQADSLTDDFHSYRGQFFGILNDGLFEKNKNFVPRTKTLTVNQRVLSAFPLSTQIPDQTVLVLDAAVGINYRTLNIGHPDFAYILQKTYHSGTACTESGESPYSLLYLQELCVTNFKRLFLAPVDQERTMYSSTRILLDAGITPLYDMPAEAAWAGLMVCTWLRLEPEDVFALES